MSVDTVNVEITISDCRIHIDNKIWDASAMRNLENKVVDLLPALLIPVRTNTLKNFSADFFLPTTIHRATRVKGIVGQIFAILGGLFLDTLTFPIRLFTALPRHLYINSRPMHAFRKEILEIIQRDVENVDKPDIRDSALECLKCVKKADHVLIKVTGLKLPNGRIVAPNESNKNMVGVEKSYRGQLYFIAVPRYFKN